MSDIFPSNRDVKDMEMEEVHASKFGEEKKTYKNPVKYEDDMDEEADALMKDLQMEDTESVTRQRSLEKLRSNPKLLTKLLVICDQKNLTAKDKGNNETCQKSEVTSKTPSQQSNDKKAELICEKKSCDTATNQNTSHQPSDSKGSLIKEKEDIREHQSDLCTVKSVHFLQPVSDSTCMKTPIPKTTKLYELSQTSSITSSIVQSTSDTLSTSHVKLNNQFDQIDDQIICHKHNTSMILHGGISTQVCSHGMKPSQPNNMVNFMECCLEDHERIIDILNGFMAGYSVNKHTSALDTAELDADFSNLRNNDPLILSKNQTVSTPKKNVGIDHHSQDKAESREMLDIGVGGNDKNLSHTKTNSLDSSLQTMPDLEENSYFNPQSHLTKDSDNFTVSSVGSSNNVSSCNHPFNGEDKTGSLNLSDPNYTFSPTDQLRDIDTVLIEYSDDEQPSCSSVQYIIKKVEYIPSQSQSGMENTLNMDTFNRVICPIPEENSVDEPDFKTPFTSVTEFQSMIDLDTDTNTEFETPHPSECWLGKRNSVGDLGVRTDGNQETVCTSFYQQENREVFYNPTE